MEIVSCVNSNLLIAYLARKVEINKSLTMLMLIGFKIPGNVYWRIEGMRDDEGEASGCLSNHDGSLNVLHVYWSNKSY